MKAARKARAPQIAPPPASVAPRDGVALAATMVAVATVAAYANTFAVPMLLDDSLSLVHNETIRSLGHFGDVLTPSGGTPTAGRPLLNLSFALNYAWGGLAVPGYHAVNLLIHVLAALTLLGVARRTLRAPTMAPRWRDAATPLAAVIAGLWALHPLQTESVTYISQRAESLMGLFYLLTLYAFVRSTASASAGRWRAASVAACLAGMATKEVMVTAPVVVFLYDRVFVGGGWRSCWTARRGYYVALAACWLPLAALMATSHLADRGVGYAPGFETWRYVLTEAKVIVSYLRLAVWPAPLVFDYGPEVMVKGLAEAAPYLLAMVAAAAGGVLAGRRWPGAGFLVAVFFILLAPTSSVVPVALQPMAESRMYLPLAAVVSLAVVGTYARWGRKAWPVAGAVGLALGATSAARNHDYRTALAIWEDTARKNPHAARVHTNLGQALSLLPGRTADAATEYERALAIDPTVPEAHSNLADELVRLPARQDEAIPHYETALRIKPRYPEAHNNLALQLARIPARRAEALAHYDEALRLRPNFGEAHYNRGLVLAALQLRPEESIREFETAERLLGGFHELYANLGSLLEKTGRPADAVAAYRRGLALGPDGKLESFLAGALASIPGRQAEAIAHYQEAIRQGAGSAEVHYNLGVALEAMPARAAEARAQFERAVQLKPELMEARYSLGRALAREGRLDESIAQLEFIVRVEPNYRDAKESLAALKAMRGR